MWLKLTWSCWSPLCSDPTYTPAGFAISQTALRFSPWQPNRNIGGMNVIVDRDATGPLRLKKPLKKTIQEQDTKGDVIFSVRQTGIITFTLWQSDSSCFLPQTERLTGIHQTPRRHLAINYSLGDVHERSLDNIHVNKRGKMLLRVLLA